MPFLDLPEDRGGGELGEPPDHPRRRKRKKGPPGERLGDTPMVPDSPLASDDEGDGKPARPPGPRQLQEAHMLKLPKTPRGREKALEKELPWSFIPASQHEAFRAAEQKQWEEHRDHSALEPLSVEDSRKISATKDDRILGSRFAYRDKHWSKRKQDNELPWKPKARLVIAGHRDPDLSLGTRYTRPHDFEARNFSVVAAAGFQPLVWMDWTRRGCELGLLMRTRTATRVVSSPA